MFTPTYLSELFPPPLPFNRHLLEPCLVRSRLLHLLFDLQVVELPNIIMTTRKQQHWEPRHKHEEEFLMILSTHVTKVLKLAMTATSTTSVGEERGAEPHEASHADEDEDPCNGPAQ